MTLRTHLPRHRLVASSRLLLPCGFTAVALSTASAQVPSPPAPASVRIPRFLPEDQPVGLRAGEATALFWQNARLTATPTSTSATPQQIQKSIRALLTSDPTMSQAYSWRQVLRGIGTQKWSLTESSAGNVQLQLGQHTLPVMQLTGVRGNRAAAGLSSNAFGIYSTKPLNLLNSRLRSADALIGETVSYDETEMNWVTFQPLKTKQGTIDLVYLQGQNDLSPTSTTKLDSQFRRGSMMGAKVAYALPARWKLDGEWMNGKMEDQEPDDALIFALAGPMKHPWGETGVRFSYRDIGTDFSSFAGTPTDAGQTTKQLSLNQPFKKGDFSGSLGLNMSQIEANDEQATTVAVANDTNLQATSNLRWQATPEIAVTASHAAGSRMTAPTIVDPLLPATLVERENRDSRVGLEWKLSKQFSLSASGGLTQYDEETASNRLLRRLSNRDNYYAVALKNQSTTTQWNLKYERRIAQDLEGDTGSTGDTISLGAQKKLTSWLKFGGSYRLTQTEYLTTGLDVPQSDITANTTLSLQELGSLELRYTQVLNSSTDGVRLTGQTRANTVGVRYVLGQQNGRGFGLSVDYSRSELNGPADQQWKLGLTYR